VVYCCIVCLQNPKFIRRRSCENDPRALCFAGVLVDDLVEIRRAADLGDAFAQAWMADKVLQDHEDEEFLRWAEKSAGQGERDGFCSLGRCYRYGVGCEKDAEIAKKNFFDCSELADVHAMVSVGTLLDQEDPQRFVWFGGAAATMGDSLGSFSFLD
jgi:TPR repeat protein